VDTYADAQRAGSGAVSVDGKMIDVPIVERARQLLARVQAIRARQAVTGS
jgi:citrate lyase subunit beta/citryl-CoA lyase